ncbi:helix-turn-helix domain-containing protein [Thiospirochaeta perfilievii]|uniref:Helix-turn-helix domain-containing protein n=1 Tax=Thiospirochaeta perfilievii TaxID=252967 RepID=A0A5C1Q8W2_9SPIO|nr:helix-turn-helix domain-containing protein [Thiospirochaeta perfilievii]QEN03877.1 helix-turn-helix domain-containing protein [Thiospirochaeta perfilievii]
MESKSSFGERFKTLRKSKKLTQKEVAKELGLGQSAIANYEQGTRFPDEKTLRQITKYFNTSLDYLMNIKTEGTDIKNRVEISSLFTKYKKLILSNKFPEALKLILNAQDSGIDIIEIFNSIFLPLLKHTGELWECSIIDVAKEHLISEELERTIVILTYRSKTKELKNIRCVCATPGGELHRISIRIVSEILKREGYPTWFLGVNTPTKDIIELCKKNSIDFLILSSTMPSSIDSANNIIYGIRLDKSLDNCKIIVGGPAYEKDRRAEKVTRADFVINNLQGIVDTVNNLAN